MVEIERVAGFVPTRSWGSAFKDLVWAIGMSDDLTLPAEQQINRAFKNLDNVLEEVASDKTQIISATVMQNDIKDKPLMDEVWADHVLVLNFTLEIIL